MKKLLLAALLLAVAGPAIADDYCSSHFCLTPPPLPPNIYVTPSDEAYFVNASTAVPRRWRSPSKTTSAKRRACCTPN
jgi:hypothetical protein